MLLINWLIIVKHGNIHSYLETEEVIMTLNDITETIFIFSFVKHNVFLKSALH